MELSERDLKLKEKYPEILKDLGGDPSKTCMSAMHGGIDIGDGWIPLLEKVFAICQFHHDKNGYPQLVAEQIKEKFGTLRFYYSFFEDEHSSKSSDYLEGIIDFACDLTSEICEKCGKPSKLHGKGWLTTECKECEEERLRKVKNIS